LNEFEIKILLYDYPSVPCTYCSMLMMGPSVMWVPYDSSESYMLTSAFPKNVDLSKHLSISILILFVL
ncbi:5013_t:CDS:1, partial [Entrophospora sp. SA101]